MYDVIGRYNTAKIFATVVDGESYSQVLRMCNNASLAESKIRMMPDMHAAEGCTVGTSMTVGGSVNPSYIGSDIGCGMQVYRFKGCDLDLARLDKTVRELIPSGASVFEKANTRLGKIPLDSLFSRGSIDVSGVGRSLGTLGGGNHFIEIDESSDGSYFLVIHSGSRLLGKQVAAYHQSAAFFTSHGITPEEAAKRRLRPSDINGETQVDECFLSGVYMERYLNDMDIAVGFADQNRKDIGETLIERMGLDVIEEFSTIHNYIDTKVRVLRKGAVSAAFGEKLLIPINMRDGSLVCLGKGNEDWNYTAPHGAGRLMKRSEAKRTISLEEYREAMKGIYTTSVDESTLDESPMAYRSIDDIVDAIEPTCEILDIITPIYNFKASKAPSDD